MYCLGGCPDAWIKSGLGAILLISYNDLVSMSRSKLVKWLSVLAALTIVVLAICSGLVYCFFLEGGVSAGSERYTANGNDMATIQSEVNSSEFRDLLASVAHVNQWRARNIEIEAYSGGSSWTIRNGVNSSLTNSIRAYLSPRMLGHSAAYCRDVMMHGRDQRHTAVMDAIQSEYGDIPRNWIHKTTLFPSKDGATTRVIVLDGEVAWSFDVACTTDGAINYVSMERVDAVEFSPAYDSVINEVKREVEEKMAKEDIKGLGSCHTYWHLQKDLLKKRGITWRCPTEMNPDTCYD